MSEHLHHNPEAHEAHPAPETQAEHPRLSAEQAAKAVELQRHKVEAAAVTAEQEARTTEQVTASHEQKPAAPSHHFVSRELKNVARARQLKHVREHLPTSERTFSKVIHQPVIDSLSEIGGKTVARPSGMLAGGICALLGSSIFLYIAKHYGYRYNFLLWAIFFVGGFFLGLIIELIVAVVRRVKA